ncbi:hypothetical protein D3230_07185 [Leucobacter chromiireducens subsp. solipictus]|uniref:Uncharacterized protein n=1 Tax=Leucobacter chromiireducens subsp. solipictus TaxID=398235 RepID=A0ABS1SGR6_9MICO|nr:hypothetical protein [Leucobacter chromiireducens subsp. solipictus]
MALASPIRKAVVLRDCVSSSCRPHVPRHRALSRPGRERRLARPPLPCGTRGRRPEHGWPRSRRARLEPVARREPPARSRPRSHELRPAPARGMGDGRCARRRPGNADAQYGRAGLGLAHPPRPGHRAHAR